VTIALWLLALQGVIGAFDTLYFHEWRARLAARVPATSDELRLHAARDLIYAAIFATLPRLAWQGAWSIALAALLVAEVLITLSDFVVEERVRRPLGGVYPGERVTHALMGIIYGAMLAHLLPVLRDWWDAPTALTAHPDAAPAALKWLLTLMAVGVALSGVRDLCAVLGVPHGGWPWRVQGAAESGGRR
jgi:hypothetical protein